MLLVTVTLPMAARAKINYYGIYKHDIKEGDVIECYTMEEIARD